MKSPKEALQSAVDLIADCIPDDLVEKPEYLRQIEAAIPIAELEHQAMELLRQYVIEGSINASELDFKGLVILTQLEALK